MKRKTMRTLLCVAVVALIMTTMSVTAFAATGDVAGAVENTWNAAKSQVQTVVNNVVFPVIDMILAVLFFVKVGTSYFEYRKHGQFEFAAPCILFACLIFTLTAPLYIWTIIAAEKTAAVILSPKEGETQCSIGLEILSPALAVPSVIPSNFLEPSLPIRYLIPYSNGCMRSSMAPLPTFLP